MMTELLKMAIVIVLQWIGRVLKIGPIILEKAINLMAGVGTEKQTVHIRRGN